MTTVNEQLSIKLETLQNLLMSRATGGGSFEDERLYQSLRKELQATPSLEALLPRFIKVCRDLGHFWEFIKAKFETYAERRAFIRAELAPLRDAAEGRTPAPSDEPVSALLRTAGAGYIHDTWQKALQRREQDPEGAITSARTLLETVCKAILDDEQIPYEAKEDLPALYGKTAKTLQLAPSQHPEEVFRRILGGCHSVVEGLGTLRNQLGDSHGRTKPIKPAPRHAALAVNLAGAMAAFLWETAQARGGPT
jgi:hypothetical protein